MLFDNDSTSTMYISLH